MTNKFDDIKAHFLAEQTANKAPRVRGDIPLSYESITPGWLNSILQDAYPGINVTGFSLGDIDNGTSSRRRIHLEYLGNPSGPESMFCKGSPNLENRYILGMNNGIAAEVHFYNVVRPILPIEAPRAFYANYDARSFNSIIVMYDMKDEVTFCPIDTPMTLARGKSQMRLLARLHGEYYAKPERMNTLSGFNTWEEYFKATVDLAGFRSRVCARLCGRARSHSAVTVQATR